MRGDSSTKRGGQKGHEQPEGSRWRSGARRRAWLSRLMPTLGLVALVSGGCDPGYPTDGSGGASSQASYSERAAVRWTMNGVPLSDLACKSLLISSMQVTIQSRLDPSQAVQFESVACGLNLYSMAGLPSGPVSITVDGIKQGSAGDCVQYSGSVSTSTTDQFPSTPSLVPLLLVANCP